MELDRLFKTGDDDDKLRKERFSGKNIGQKMIMGFGMCQWNICCYSLCLFFLDVGCRVEIARKPGEVKFQTISQLFLYVGFTHWMT